MSTYTLVFEDSEEDNDYLKNPNGSYTQMLLRSWFIHRPYPDRFSNKPKHNETARKHPDTIVHCYIGNQNAYLRHIPAAQFPTPNAHSLCMNECDLAKSQTQGTPSGVR